MKQSLRAKRMARNHRRHQATAKLNLVSLMDIFTILVFFLMVNNGDVEVLTADESIELPDSTAEQKPALTLTIKVNEDYLMVEGREMGRLDNETNIESAIAALNTELAYRVSKRSELTDLEKEKGRSVIIMGDQAVPYRVLKSLMSTCSANDYRDISLAVNRIADKSLAQAQVAPSSARGS